MTEICVARAGATEKDDRAGRARESRARQSKAFGGNGSSNMTGSRDDKWADEDNPFLRFKENHALHRTRETEALRVWPMEALVMPRQPCHLCDAGFDDRASLLEHIVKEHGGLQKYRNAMLCLQSLCPHVVVGSEVRYYVSNYSTFLRHASMDWEGPHLTDLRGGRGCAFCARWFWSEEMWPVQLAGEQCFMQNSPAVWTLLSVDRYHQRWPKIPLTELQASGVQVCCPDGSSQLVLLHKRQVSAAAARGQEPVHVCSECHQAFAPKKPRLCKFALANDLGLGRIDPLLWDANMTHEMCLALARTVATKVVLRAGGAQTAQATTERQWDHVYQQTGYVGSSVLFHNGDAKHALQSLPPEKLNDALAITFCTDLPVEDDVDHGREAIRKIVQLRLRKDRFLQQAQVLQDTNVVYAGGVTQIDSERLTAWLGGEDDVVPPVVLDCVLTVPVGRDGPGTMRQEGPAQATDGHVSCSQDEVVFATEPEVKDFNDDETDVSSRVAIMLQKLEELEAAGARSVAVEMASLMEDDAVLLDHLGRRRIQKLCDEIQETCRKLSTQDMRRKLEVELRDAVMGKSPWLLPEENAPEEQSQTYEAQHLMVARDKKPLSLFDWKIWSMAKPRLWRYGDASNLFDREEPLSTAEWTACMLRREDVGG